MCVRVYVHTVVAVAVSTTRRCQTVDMYADRLYENLCTPISRRYFPFRYEIRRRGVDAHGKHMSPLAQAAKDNTRSLVRLAYPFVRSFVRACLPTYLSTYLSTCVRAHVRNNTRNSR